MKAILALAAVVAVCASLVWASDAASGDQRPVIGIAYGNTLVGMSDARLAQALDDAVTVGGTTVRTDLDWNDVQPQSADEFLWTKTDRVVAEAQRRGLSLIMVLVGTPPWARAPGCTHYFCAPTDPARFAAFAGASAKRYTSSGVLAWEVWNEPNTAGFWWPKPDPAAYTALLVDAARAIRAENPQATVILGGLASVDNADGTISESDFLTAVCSSGGNHAVDGVAFHPYTFPDLAGKSTGPWSRISSSPDSLHAVLSRYGTPQLRIWITEFGAPTGGPGAGSDGSSPIPANTTHVTEARQTHIAADVVPTVRADPTIAALVWYSDQDLSADTSTNLNFFGLRRADGSQKPAFDGLRRAVASLERPQT